DQNPCQNSYDDGRVGGNESTGSSDRDQSGEHTVAGHGDVRFLEEKVPEQERGCRTSNRRQVSVYRDDGDAKIRRTQRGTRIESHPSEKKDERAGNHEDDVMGWEGPRLTVRAILPQARTQDDREC